MKQFFLLFSSLVFMAIPLRLLSQNKKLLSGTVIDGAAKEPLPFASVALKKQLIGIVTNDEGKFDLYIPEELTQDTLVVTFFGFKNKYIPITSFQNNSTIKLEASSVMLEEVVIRPMPPEHYIRMAMRKTKLNYPSKPFETVAYYREKILENKKLIACNEGVFKTYYPNYTDTVDNTYQLMLFRKAENTSEVAFMSAEKKKKEEKEKKTGKKKEGGIEMDTGTSFGGPESILKSTNLSKKVEGSLDTTQLKEYKYAFAKSSSYNNQELMVIDFSSRGKVDHLRESGKIYIHLNTMAIIKFESSGELVIPVIIRPILFMYGLGIENPDYTKEVVFQEVKGKWYPQNFQYNIDIKLTNRHWFRANEHSDFEIEQVFTVNKTKTEDATPVPAAKRFHSDKDMKTQVFNDEGLTWEGLNIIKQN